MTSTQAALWVVILLVALALAFDFMNGFHDAANSIATVVSTKVLTPRQAVMWAAFWAIPPSTVVVFLILNYRVFRGAREADQ